MANLLIRALHALWGHYNGWRNRQQAYAELYRLDDRSLADIGITRSEIPYVLTHPQASRQPIWAKRKTTNRPSHA
jgi:uncharacterized protein YjiS (DUF1127 family)